MPPKKRNAQASNKNPAKKIKSEETRLHGKKALEKAKGGKYTEEFFQLFCRLVTLLEDPKAKKIDPSKLTLTLEETEQALDKIDHDFLAKIYREIMEEESPLNRVMKKQFRQWVEIFLDIPNNKKSWSATLLQATGKDQHLFVELLIDIGIDPNVQDEFGATALMMAAARNFPTSMEVLFKKGAKYDLRNKHNQTALGWAAYKGSVQAVELLLEKYNFQNNKHLHQLKVALVAAGRIGHAPIMDLLLVKGAVCNWKDEHGWTALMSVAAMDCNGVGVKLLLDRGANHALQNNELQTALILAAKNGRTENVRLLISAVADLHVKDLSGRSALIYAMYGGHENSVELLLEKYDFCKDEEFKDGVWALLIAAEKGHVPVMDLLFKKGIHPDVQSPSSWTALMSAAAIEHSGASVELLLGRGANHALQNNEHQTALILAARNGRTENVRLLIAAGADLDVKDCNGWTALMWAAEKRYPEIVKKLVDAFASMAPSGSPWSLSPAGIVGWRLERALCVKSLPSCANDADCVEHIKKIEKKHEESHTRISFLKYQEQEKDLEIFRYLLEATMGRKPAYVSQTTRVIDRLLRGQLAQKKGEEPPLQVDVSEGPADIIADYLQGDCRPSIARVVAAACKRGFLPGTPMRSTSSSSAYSADGSDGLDVEEDEKMIGSNNMSDQVEVASVFS